VDYNIQYMLTVVDQLTPALRRAQAQIKNMDKLLRGLGKTVHIKLDVAQAKAALKSLKSPELKASVKAAAQTAGGTGRGRRGSSAVIDGAVGSSMLAPLIYATKSAVGFESSMVEVAKATNLTGAPLEDMKRRIMELSNTTGTAAVDVGDMLATFARGDSSLSPDALVEYSRMAVEAVGALDGVNKDQASAAILRAGADFKLSASEVRNFMGGVDLLSDTIATLDPAPLLDYATAVSPIARGMGMAKEEAMAFGATLLSSGYEAGQSSAALDNLFRMLRSGKGDGGFKQLGLDANALRKMKPEQVLNAMADAAKSIDPSKFTEIGTAIGGIHYGKELTAMLVNVDKYNQSLGLMNDKTAQSTRLSAGFEKFLASSAGQLAIARQEAENAGIALGGTFAPMIASAARSVGDFVQNLNQNYPALLKVLVGGLAVAGGLIVMGAAVSLTGSALSSLSVVSAFAGKSIGMLKFVFAEGLLSTNMLSAGVMRLNAAFLANPIGVVVMALAAFVALCALAWDHSATLRETVGKLAEPFVALGNILGITTDFGTAFDYVMVGIGASLSAALIPITGLIENFKLLGSAWDNIQSGNYKGAAGDIFGAMTGGGWRKEIERVGTGAVRDWKGVGAKKEANAYSGMMNGDSAYSYARAPVITAQPKIDQIRVQAGIGGGGGADKAAQAAQLNQQSASTGVQTAQQNAQAVETMMNAASKQSDASSQLGNIINQFSAAVSTFAATASKPLTVNVAGSLGDQGRG
jgi:TP901 family phage tail tape measure protein